MPQCPKPPVSAYWDLLLGASGVGFYGGEWALIGRLTTQTKQEHNPDSRILRINEQRHVTGDFMWSSCFEMKVFAKSCLQWMFFWCFTHIFGISLNCNYFVDGGTVYI